MGDNLNNPPVASQYKYKGASVLSLNLSMAIAAAKITSFLCRWRGRRGTALPGLFARSICPRVLTVLSRQVKSGIVVVTGTNGKTTTSNMIAQALARAGLKVIANREGANLLSGVTTSFVMNAGLNGNIDCDFAVLEVDEASVPRVLSEVRPKAVVLTNFFRDQLDRYWELDKIVGKVSDALKDLTGATLVLNADDPLVAQFEKSTGLPAVFYGFRGGGRAGGVGAGGRTRESRYCPFCGSPLEYEFFNYGQLGKYRCAGCAFKRKKPSVEASGVRSGGGATSCRLVYGGQDMLLTLRSKGLYNLYNALAVFAVCSFLGLKPGAVLEALWLYRPVTGRMEMFTCAGKSAVLCLVKNPAGFNEGLADLVNVPGTVDVFIAVNDNFADGRDISWLWDVDFEVLENRHSRLLRFVCSGLRGEEMALRLKYAGIPVEKIIIRENIADAVKCALAGEAGKVYLFCTYSALWPAYNVLSKLSDKESADAVCMPSIS